MELGLSAFLRSLLDALYPPRCHACDRPLGASRDAGSDRARSLCGACVADLSPVGSPRCPVCGIPFPGTRGEDHPCGACLAHPPAFDGLQGLYLYEGPVQKAVHRLKYGHRTSVAGAFGPEMGRVAVGWLGPGEGLRVMPVPLHPKRLRERGFNQSLLLARHVAGALGCPLDFLSLRRVKWTVPQAGLSREERKRNVQGAFAVRGGVRKGRVLLVDDVATTGDTLAMCSRTLKKAGYASVHCLTLARTP